MRRNLLWLLVCAACHRSAANATPTGSVVLAWDLAHAERAEVRSATFANPTTKDLTYRDPAVPGVTLALHVESARIQFTSEGKPVTHGSVVKLTETITENPGYEASRARCMGPDYQLAAPGQAPDLMILGCVVHLTRPNEERSIFIQLLGDGSVIAP